MGGENFWEDFFLTPTHGFLIISPPLPTPPAINNDRSLKSQNSQSIEVEFIESSLGIIIPRKFMELIGSKWN